MFTRLLTSFRSFVRRPLSDWCLLGEAIIYLIWSKTRLYTTPFSRIAPDLGTPQAETLKQVAESHRASASKISWAVQTGARYIPLRLVCLPQAMAATTMLSRRGIPSTLYLGVKMDQANALTAHAWLRAGFKWVTGGKARHGQSVVAYFAKIDSRPVGWISRFRISIGLGVLASLAVFTLMPSPPLYDITWQNAPPGFRDLLHQIGSNDYWFNFFGFSAAGLLFNISLYGFRRETFRYRWFAIVFFCAAASLLEGFQLVLPGRNFDPLDVLSAFLAIPLISSLWIRIR